MGEFSPPFFEPPSFFFFSYPSNIDSNIEIIFDFSDFHPPFHPPFQNPGSAPDILQHITSLHFTHPVPALKYNVQWNPGFSNLRG